MIIVDLIKELMYQQKIAIEYMINESGLLRCVVENVVIKEIAPTPEDAKVMLWVLGVKLEDVLCLY